MDTNMEQRFFETAFELAVDAREDRYEFPLVIAFSDQNHKLAAVLTIKEFGKVLPGLEWETSGWVWAWEPGHACAEPFQAALTSHDGRTRTATVSLLSFKEEIEIMDKGQIRN